MSAKAVKKNSEPAVHRHRFFIARPGDIIPRTHMQAWCEWEVGDRQGMVRICLTSCKRKAEVIRDALEAFHQTPKP